MVTFLHTDAGTPVAVWADAMTAAPPAELDLSGLRRLVVVAAHPDDETLGAGGLMALAAAAGVPVEVIVATDGEASHPESTTHTPAALAEIRRREVAAAVAQVAPAAQLSLLHLPDSGLAAHLASLTADLQAQLGTPERGTWLVSPWVEDGHTDHHAAGTAARDAAAAHPDTVTLLQYPIWAWHWGHPTEESVPADLLRTLPLPDAAHRDKQLALAAHHSQLHPLSDADGDETLLPATTVEFFDQDREFFVVAGNATPRAPADPAQSLSVEFFDDFYGDRDDPWQFESLWYEERKRALTLASLPRRRFEAAFEPGCSIGVLTDALARRCDRLLSADISDQPLQRAAQRLAWADHVEFRRLQIPHDWPDGSFDLIILSEVGYYCGSDDLDLLIDRAARSLSPDGVLVACHWRYRVEAYPMLGDEVHRRLRRHPDLAILSEHREADFLLDVLVRPPAVSVAARDGLA